MLKPPTPNYKDIVPLLQSHETMKNLHVFEETGSLNQNVAFYGQRQGNRNSKFTPKKGKQNHFTSKGRGFNTGSPHANQSVGDSSTTRTSSAASKDKEVIVCQICKKPNHDALQCYNRFNQTYQSEHLPQALAAMKLSDSQDSAWFPDTGASAHMTADSGKLSSITPYYGSDKILVGDGNALDITHTGSTSLNVGDQHLNLNNVLVVPQIKKNLLSVSQLTAEHPLIFIFSKDGFLVKNRDTGTVMASGSRCGGLYSLQPNNKEVFFSTRFRVADDDIWHLRLGHPHMNIVDFLKRKKFISSKLEHNSEKICDSYQT
ncbi:hypothetical protein ACHQM5_030565 [Ranunculus cassubicifolius]